MGINNSLSHWQDAVMRNPSSSCVCSVKTVKRPRKVPVQTVKTPPSPEGHDWPSDYDEYERHSSLSSRKPSWPEGNGGLGYPRKRDQSLERGRGAYLEPDYRTRGYGRDQEYSRGRSVERDERDYRRDGSRGRTLSRELSPERRYPKDHSRGRSVDRDRDLGSPTQTYNSRDLSYERRRFEPRADERMLRSRSRDQLADRSPSPDPRAHDGDREPLEKPINVLLVKNRPNEGRTAGLQLERARNAPA